MGTSLTFRIALTIILMGRRSQGDKVVVKAYQHDKCGGWENTQDLKNSCHRWTNIGNQISGIRIVRGSCARVSSLGENPKPWFFLTYPRVRYCSLWECCREWNDKVGVVCTCDSTKSVLKCPENTYVREISHDHSYTDGITLWCYAVGSTTPNVTLKTHPHTTPHFNKQGCNVAAFGLSAFFSDPWEFFWGFKLRCNRPPRGHGTYMELGSDEESSYRLRVPDGDEFSDSFTEPQWMEPQSEFYAMNESVEVPGDCKGPNGALVGLEVVIDEAYVIKDLHLICRKVKNPAELCEPAEWLTTVVTCDNSKSQNPMECSYSMTIGTEVSTELTETERRELKFSQELGFEEKASVGALSATMSQKLGASQLVGYTWSRSDTRTWSKTETVSSTIKIRPGTMSRLEQLAGKCTFFGVMVNYFRQVDIYPNGTTTYKPFNL